MGETDDFEWDDVKDARTRANRDLSCWRPAGYSTAGQGWSGFR
jgi:hypothetical protein